MRTGLLFTRIPLFAILSRAGFKRMKKLNFSYFILSIALLLCVGGCQKMNLSPEKTQSSFDSFTNDLFLYEVQSDSLTLNYTLSNPENFGISDFTPTLGDYGVAKMQKHLTYYENAFKKLKEYDYAKLTKEQQTTYDVLFKSLENELESSDYLYYMESLGPTTGIQTQLPILLAEYNFHTKQDIDDYIALLGDVPNYFNQILAFEKEKSKQGLFMSDETVEGITSQCKKFIENPEQNLMIEVFNDRILNYEGLTGEEANSYMEQNKKAVLTSIIPAYESLINELTALKGTGKNTGGLSHFPKGKNYYELLVKSTSGSSRSIEEIESMLNSAIGKSQSKLSATMRKSPDSVYEAMSPSYPLEEPEEIISYLKSAITKDFPSIGGVDCQIKYVHPSLEDDISPAFYLTPALDAYTDNSIYINNSKLDDTSSLFTTLAHEGYPGHLYQTVYFNQQNPPLIRNVLHFGGYSEGWATYVELYSYSYAGFGESTRTLLENNTIATLCVYAKCDIGINYHGWSLEDTGNYLKDFGIMDEEVVSTIYKTMVAEPSNYMKYTLGYLEFMQLKEKAQNALSDQFVPKEFHEFLLKTGPTWFDLIDEQLDVWIEERK